MLRVIQKFWSNGSVEKMPLKLTPMENATETWLLIIFCSELDDFDLDDIQFPQCGLVMQSYLLREKFNFKAQTS